MEKRSLAVREFEGLVRDAVKSLPKEFKRKLENINIVIQGEPSARQKKEAGMGAGEDLLGLYEGVPLGERTHTTRRLRSSPLQRLERDHLAHTQLQRIGHRLQALN